MMQSICLLISTLFVSIQLKSTRGALIEENESRSAYRLKPSSGANIRELLNRDDEESWLESYKISKDSDDSNINGYQTFNNVDLLQHDAEEQG